MFCCLSEYRKIPRGDLDRFQPIPSLPRARLLIFPIESIGQHREHHSLREEKRQNQKEALIHEEIFSFFFIAVTEHIRQ